MNTNEINEDILKDSKVTKLEIDNDEAIDLSEGIQPLNNNDKNLWFKNFPSFQADKRLIIIVLLILCISIISFLVSLNFIKIYSAFP